MIAFQEGDTINVDVTCPGATLALSMIYLKTNNRCVFGGGTELIAPFN